ncbi:hypothetical protein [Psychromicrobium lacuslunae]|uniref:Uncharacterized protein n=1 Tax=Psychromicrobium lacuslunae TaxID=1618207 RepID=A0A0D4C1Y7_9MICC|nr:hypothetical protein [Psychromicrobium lacuslunae]AJT42687.1 hypothetical protein UM93_16600 [Psychromicrobium lacuslunae]
MSGSDSVLPVVDTVLGTVNFSVRGEWYSFWSREPAALVAALSNSVGRCCWQPAANLLVVPVAKTGRRAGEQLSFRLLPHSAENADQLARQGHHGSPSSPTGSPSR